MSVTDRDAQTDFLAACVADAKVVWVFLVNGIRLTGSIASFDMHAVLLQSPTGNQLVFKHAIATVCEPYTPISNASGPSSSVPRRERRPPRQPCG
ncbi:RNA chaperone Hfq [Paraburkholderia azotifigens]|uniref:RNA chaperone Hfq n=1 Tax=Paraburkholderia azotifigens TaxID=2057004 RepID=UPI00316BD5E4